jgi:hypothetical protein
MSNAVIAGHQFRAAMWRYAQAWDGQNTPTGVGRSWVENILKTSREECMRRAWESLNLSRKTQR